MQCILTAVSQDEFDEAIATLTAMYDMLNAQVMTIGGDVAALNDGFTQLQSNTVKRCMYSTMIYFSLLLPALTWPNLNTKSMLYIHNFRPIISKF